MLSPRRIGVVAAVVAAGLIAAGVIVVAEDEQPSPPAPQQPAPRGLDNEGDLRLIRQTPTRIVLGWTPELTGYGYLFSGDGTVVARTTDPSRATATFRNIYASYEVAAIDKGDTGTYSPLAGTLTMTVIAETANTITFGWTPQAEYGYLFSGDGDVISRTYDPNRSYAKFNKSYTDYEVAVLVKGVTGTYPPGPPAGDLMGWELTASNVGLAPHGLNCDGLETYTTNPVPADTTIYRKKIVTTAILNLDAGGITIDQSCFKPTSLGGGHPLFGMDSTDPPNPNVVKDSEVDGSLLGQEEAAFTCVFRGIWSELSRNYVHDMGNGICMVDYDDTISYDSLIENNLMADAVAFGDPETTGSHNEAGTVRCHRIDINPSRTTTWRGNALVSDSGNDTAGFFYQATFGCQAIGNVYMENNLFDGNENWDVAGDGTGYSGDFTMENNRFVDRVGDFGYCAVSGFTFDVWTENYVYDLGNPPDYQGASIGSC